MKETTFFFNEVGGTCTIEVHLNRKLDYRKTFSKVTSFSEAVAKYEQWKQDQELFKSVMI
jgi:hypothetical protein